MNIRRSCLSLFVCFLFILLCVKGQDVREGKGRTRWDKQKDAHQGAGLSDADIQKVALLKDHKHFKRMLNPMLVPRVVGTANHRKVRQHIVTTMENLGWFVEENAFTNTTPFGEKTFTNVIATLDNKAPRRLVLCCHYDSKYYREDNFIGATDSAVPCAMIMNLAHVLRESLNDHKKTQMDLTLQLIFFDGEEAFRDWSATDSIYGARHMARNLSNTPYTPANDHGLTELHRMDLFVLLDLLGTSQSTFHNYFRETKRWYNRFIDLERRFKNKGKLKKKADMFRDNNLYGGGIEDDHIPFLERGVPVIHLIPVPFPSVWHTPGDNNSALDHDTINDFNMMLRAFVVDYLHLTL